jgi:hypothetical protein
MVKVAKPPRVSHPTRTLFISEPAYAGLCKQARAEGHIRTYSNSIGLSQYLEWVLMHCYFTDSRPPYVRAQDADMLSAFMAPEWRLHSPRTPRYVRLSNDALASACVHAAGLGMAYPPSKRILGAPTFFDGVQCAATVLEALGTGWIEAHLHE